MPKKKQKGRKSEVTLPLDDGLNDKHDGASVVTNTQGLPIFPAELLLEIMTYFPRPGDPSLNDPYIPRELDAVEADQHLAWRDASLALSQTCKSLRFFFRPYFWRRVEVREGMILQGQTLRSWYQTQALEKAHNLELVRQLEIVTVRDPTLAEYVQVVDVDVARYSDKSVLSELARCFSLFPNLRIVKLRVLRSDDKSKSVPKTVERAFGKFSYPQVSTAIVSKWVYPLLNCCTELRSVRWMDSSRSSYAFWDLRSDAARRLRFSSGLESLALGGDDNQWLAVIAEVLPSLRHITMHFNDGTMFQYYLHSAFIPLKGFKHLKSFGVSINCRISHNCRNIIVNNAKSLLLALQEEDGEMKEISIIHGPKNESTREGIVLPAPQPSA